MPPRSVYIIAETHAIAEPFVEALDLKRSEELAKLRCYVSESALLVESRGGYRRPGRARDGDPNPVVEAAVTVSFLLGSAGFDATTRCFHLGRCAASGGKGARFLGQVVLANRVRDAATRRGYFPDVLIAHEFAEAGVLTAPLSVSAEGAARAHVEGTPGGADAPPLVDREAAGFFAAALSFLAPHQVYALEAVEARLGEGEPDENGGEALRDEVGAREIFEQAAGAVLRLIEESAMLVRPRTGVLSVNAQQSLDAIVERLRLTTAQAHRLRSLASAAAVRGQDIAHLLEPWSGMIRPRTKEERRRQFDELERAFDPERTQ